MLETIVYIITIVTTILGFGLSVLLYFKKKKLAKLQEEQTKANDTEKAELQKQIDDYKNHIAELQGTLEMLQGLPDKINSAETIFGRGNGGAKKMLVITEAQTECISKGLNVDKQIISKYAEKILETPQKK